MRISTFNVESLFERAKALNEQDRKAGKPALAAFAKLNDLFNEAIYTASIKRHILTQLGALSLLNSPTSKYATLRVNHGPLLGTSGGQKIVKANGRADWIGWVELNKEPVDEMATRHTAMVLADIDAHVQGFVEVENRVSLKEFCDALLPDVKGKPFKHFMLIDGNDSRGIDVAIGSRGGYELGFMQSHVDDEDSQGVIFSRDCPAYDVNTPAGNQVTVLINHFKSKGYGSPAANDARRTRQAKRVAVIYKQLVADGQPNVVVLGDFNDTLNSQPLKPLANTDLKPAAGHPNFTADPTRPGTFGNCTANQNFDHILLSPSLYAKVTGGEVFRRGAWGGVNGTLWTHYPTMTSKAHAASDHAAVYVDVALA
jgi:endonuclease/exonuclease/phosphatase family metal-dependent hydrolase